MDGPSFEEVKYFFSKDGRLCSEGLWDRRAPVLFALQSHQPFLVAVHQSSACVALQQQDVRALLRVHLGERPVDHDQPDCRHSGAGAGEEKFDARASTPRAK